MSKIERDQRAEKSEPSEKREYDWLDDPFDEKKQEQEHAASFTRSSKLAIGGGCLAIAAGILLMAIIAFVMLGSSL